VHDVNTLDKLLQETRTVRQAFAEQGGDYSKKDRVLDLVEEVGELAQAVLVVEKVKITNDPTKQKTKADIADSLGDCLYAIWCLADDYEIDLPTTYQDILFQLKRRVEAGEFTRTDSLQSR